MKQHHFYTVCKSSEKSCALFVYFPGCLFESFLTWYSRSAMSFLGFWYIFGAGLLATSLLLSPNYDFWSGFEPRLLLQQAGLLLAEPPIHRGR
jgi:hypothetical protein